MKFKVQDGIVNVAKMEKERALFLVNKDSCEKVKKTEFRSGLAFYQFPKTVSMFIIREDHIPEYKYHLTVLTGNRREEFGTNYEAQILDLFLEKGLVQV